MILYAEGDLLQSNADVLVNPVNTQGKMGNGLALKFKNKFPNMFNTYRKACDRRELVMGDILWIDVGRNPLGNISQYVCCVPTKRNWQQPSKLKFIQWGLEKFVIEHQNYPIKTAAWPKLGCGLGGLDWTDVEILMKEYLEPLSVVSTFYV